MELEQIYSKHYGNHALESVQALGWGSEESQRVRFQVLADIGIQKEDSVLDVGCGHGGLLAYLRGRFDCFEIRYAGIDLRPSVIEIARKKFPAGVFACRSVFQEEKRYDWAVASGIFAFDDVGWWDDVGHTIKGMMGVARKGVAVNFISLIPGIPATKFTKAIYPSDFLAQLQDLYPKFTLRHDYRDNDFTVYLYKEAK